MLHLHETPVLVIGGGIAGLALGRALQARSLPFGIIERRTKPADGGLAIVLPGNAIQALATLGLRDQIEAIGHPLRRRQYRTARDKLLCEIDEDNFWGPLRRPRSVRRSALLAMLADGLPDGAVCLGSDVRKIVLHTSHAELALADGTTFDARLIVGADGVHSTVRAQAFGDSEGASQALLARASWRFMAPNPGVDCWSLWAGAAGMVLLVPVDDDVVYGWAAVTRPQPDVSLTEALEQMVQGFPERVRLAVSHALSRRDGLYYSPLEEVRLNSWHKGRAVLIGDAAHATAPVWAQGAALALEDAIVLARSLSTYSDIQTALVDYQGQRLTRVAHVKKLTDATSKTANLPPLVRNMLLPFVGPKRFNQTYEPLKAEV